MAQTEEIVYAGFWIRIYASIIDGIILSLIIIPLLIIIYGERFFTEDVFVLGPADFFLSWVFPAIGTVIFWQRKAATPGKMLIKAKVVDANTHLPASKNQLIYRYLGYFVSTIPLGLGFVMIAFDKRKQGFHDKMAGTVVVLDEVTGSTPLEFKDSVS